MKLMEPANKNILYEDVLPWLLAKRDAFLKDQADAVASAAEIVDLGIVNCQNSHADYLKKREERLIKEEQDKIEA